VVGWRVVGWWESVGEDEDEYKKENRKRKRKKKEDVSEGSSRKEGRRKERKKRKRIPKWKADPQRTGLVHFPPPDVMRYAIW
jgi:hypothetical protein